jgi:cyclic beta-1,2-glucan synthetase
MRRKRRSRGDGKGTKANKAGQPATVDPPATGSATQTRPGALAVQHQSMLHPGSALFVAPLGLRAIKRCLYRVYEQIEANFAAGRSGIRAEEWLLDNRHLVQESLAQVSEHLPRGYRRRLPRIRLTAGTLRTRIQEVAESLVREGLRPVEIGWIEEALVEYQNSAGLSIGELWALPSYLRLAVLSTLAEAASRCLLQGNRSIDSDSTEEGRSEDVAEAILSLRQLADHDWRKSFARISRVERILAGDPADAYRAMDFASRNRYRGAVEELAQRSQLSEEAVTERIVALCEESAEIDARAGHVGYYLIGPGRRTLERSLRCSTAVHWRPSRWLTRRPGLVYFGLLGALALLPLAALARYLMSASFGIVPCLLTTALAGVPALGLAVIFLNGLTAWLLPARPLPRMDFSEGVPDTFRTAVVMPVLLTRIGDITRILDRIEINYLNNVDDNLVFAILSDFGDADSASTPEDAFMLDALAQGIDELNQRHAGADGRMPFLALHRRRRWNPAERIWMGWERKRGKLAEFNDLLAGDDRTDYRIRFGDAAALNGIRFVITLDADSHLPPGAARRLIASLAHPLNQPVFTPGQPGIRAGFSILQPRLEIDPGGTTANRFTAAFAGDTRLDLYTHAVSDVYQDLFGEAIYTGKGIYDWRAFRHALEGCIPENAVLSHDLLEGIIARVGLVSDTVVLEQFPATAPAFMRRLHRWVRGDWQLLPWLLPFWPVGRGAIARPPMAGIHRWKMFDNLRRSLQPAAILTLLLLAWTGVLPGAAWAWTVALLGIQAAPVLADILSLTTRALTSPHTLVSRLRQAPSALAQPFWHWLLGLVLLPYQSQTTLDAIGRSLYRMLVSHRRLLEWTPAAHGERPPGDDASGRHLMREMWVAPTLAMVVGLAVAGINPGALPVTLPLLVAWLLAPWIAAWTAQPSHLAQVQVGARKQQSLRLIARRTWLFFERFVGPDDHWLAPDNFQEQPRAALARRTSPTNIGMALSATLAAHDFGYIDPAILLDRLRNTCDTLRRMERYRGHWLNWYQTRDLRPLQPRYVSTVDSGNLAACFLAVAEGVRERMTAPLTWHPAMAGALDTLDVFEQTLRISLAGHESDASQRCLDIIAKSRLGVEAASGHPDGWQLLAQLVDTDLPALSQSLVELVEAEPTTFGDEDLGQLRIWLDEMRRHALAWQRHVSRFMPWLDALANLPVDAAAGASCAAVSEWKACMRALFEPPPAPDRYRSGCREALSRLAELDALRHAGIFDDATEIALGDWAQRFAAQLEAAEREAAALLNGSADLAARLKRWVVEMDFRFLYDDGRHLFRIGHNVSSDRSDPNFYDLLASEARLAGFIAIAKGDVPLRHWLHLGRPLRRRRGRIILMSWSATLFEYLMPHLFMDSPRDTLIERACQTAIALHREFCDRMGLPWGISESGYYHLDESQHYQYQAFGVPDLGFRSNLGERVVVAPYGSVMALDFAPAAALVNIERLGQLNACGLYGLFEAIDYGRTEKANPRRARVVRSYMSHHQGMILLAIDNFLHDGAMKRRFHRDRRVMGISSLLHERPAAPGNALRSWPQPQGRSFQGQAGPQSWPQLRTDGLEHHTLLSNGHYSVLLDANGGGGSEWDGVALVARQSRASGRATGHWFYLKDLDTGDVFAVTPGPSEDPTGTCAVEFGPHRAEFQRRTHGVFCRMVVAVASQQDVEVRLLTLHNETNRRRRLLLVGIAEVALAPAAEFWRHPAFARLFVESECFEADQLLLFRRRPRASNDKPVFMAHMIVPPAGQDCRFGWDTDRRRILGRGGSTIRPELLNGGIDSFGRTSGAILDGAIATGLELTLEPYAQAELGAVTAVGHSRRDLLATIRSCRSIPRLNWLLEQARMQTGQELQNLEIAPSEGRDMLNLLSAVVSPWRHLRSLDPQVSSATRIQGMLWSRGISGDWPIVLVRLDAPEDTSAIEPLLKAHTFWIGRQARFDLVIVDETAGGYLQPGRDRLMQLIAAIRSRTNRKLTGSVFVLPGAELRTDERLALHAAADIVLDSRNGGFGQQLDRAAESEPKLPLLSPVRCAQWRPMPPTDLVRPDRLRFDNGSGGFADDRADYLIHLADGEMLPAPWSNVLANPNFGTLVTETGLGYSWAGNSSEARLTPWPNDPVGDRAGEVCYLRDEETGAVWSPTRLPLPAPGSHRIRHGAGFTEFSHLSHGLYQRLRVTVDEAEPVKLIRLTLRNDWPWPRRLTATYYLEWVLGTAREETAKYIVPDYAAASCALLAHNAFARQEPTPVAFLTASAPPHGLCTDRSEFLDSAGDSARPSALDRIGLSGRIRTGDDPCAAYQVHLDIPAGGTATVYFALGQGPDRDAAIALAQRFRSAEFAGQRMQQSEQSWQRRLEVAQFETPEPAMDLLLNRWLPYQTLACRMWGRSGYYQSSGAFGFRDQLQDALALLWSTPEATRAHLLLAASRQFQEGDVLHWWHECPLRGVRTRCSDDLLWLPFSVAHYVASTGDAAVLGESVPYLSAPPLADDEAEHYTEVGISGERGSLYEHCCRAIDRASVVGPHGLPTIGSGDWNDGFNRVSTSGRGESVWLAWFMARVCEDFAGCCLSRGDPALAERYRCLAGELRERAESQAWDGLWYRRAYTDDGTPLGSAENDECRIDLIAQAWSVLAAEPPTARAARAMDSAWEHLVREQDRLILLLAPPFDKTRIDPGYIKGYPPGVRENGGQYTHAATWSVWAFAALGNGERAAALFRLLNPILRTVGPEAVAHYRVEPYVLTGDVYGAEPHIGRGGWSWYTGASGWLYRAGVEAILGLRQRGERLEIKPCLPRDWPGYRAQLSRGRACYEITVEQSQIHSGCVIEFDGKRQPGNCIRFVDDGQRHRVWVRLATAPADGPGLPAANPG